MMTTTETATTTGRPAEPLARRLVRGVLAGLVAGAVFIAINMWFVASNGGAATDPFRLISTLVLGASAMESGTASVALGVVLHGLISILFGVSFALVAPMFRTNGTIALAGGVYGILVYALDFLVLTPLFFEQFRAPNAPLEFAAHVVFGHVLATFFYSVGTRRDEPFLAIGGLGSSTG